MGWRVFVSPVDPLLFLYAFVHSAHGTKLPIRSTVLNGAKSERSSALKSA